jgi:hypothetical protein
MKKALTTTLLSILFFTARSQFGPVFFIDTVEVSTISQVACVDINHDDKPDILTAHQKWPKDFMHAYVQTGDKVFVQQALPGVDSFSNFESFATGDIFEDGWTDFIVASEFPSRIMLYENAEGIFIQHLVADSLDITLAVLAEDFNHDGLLDILALQHTEIVLYLAIAEGVFDTPKVIHSGTEFYAIDAGHYNQDTFLDVSVASDGFDILLGDGAGNYELIESPHIGLTFHLQSADLDGDTDIDIAVYESLRGILFFSNNGQGHFTRADTILDSPDIFDTYQLGDMDCDGDIDLLTSVPQPGSVRMIENDGLGHFDTYTQLHVQPGELIRAVTLGDIDSDSEPDAIWGNKTLGATINQCTMVAIEEPALIDDQVIIYPNPSAGEIKISNPRNHSILITVFDAVGNILIHDKTISASSEYQITMGSPGIYFLQYKYENEDPQVKNFLIIPD